MSAQEVDVVVVGLGPGGESVATQLATAGLEVLAVDRRLVGGECPYYGCIPSKMMVRAADVLAETRRVQDFAGTASVSPDFTPVARRIKEEATTDWDDTVAVERLQKAGATVVHGSARILGPRQVDVDGTRYQARKGIVLNTGTEPSAPPIDGLADTPYWTNRDVVRVETAPGSLVVLGGGAIGAELAQAFARFGTRVTVLELADRILAPEEPEASKVVADVFAHEGIQVLTGVSVDAVSYDDGTFRVRVDDQERHRGRHAGRGRHAATTSPTSDSRAWGSTLPRAPSTPTAGCGSPAPRVSGPSGTSPARARTRTCRCTRRRVAVRDILGQDGPEAAYHAVPRVTFTDPEVGSVGLSEKQARDAGLHVQVGTTDLAASTRGWIAKAEGVIKVVADADRGVLVGATVVGPSGGEVLSMLAIAVHAEVPVATLRSMIYAYPTFHRAVDEAVKDLR